MKVRNKIDDYDADDSEAHEKLSAPADWRGPVQRRRCTDVLCLGLIIVAWICMTGIGIHAAKNGDFRYTIYPLDYDGNVCGTDNQFKMKTVGVNNSNYQPPDMTDYPNLLYVNSFTGGVCVNACPSVQGLVSDNLTDIRTLVTYNGLWQTSGAELPQSSLDQVVKVADYSNATDVLMCTQDICYPTDDPQDSWNSLGIARGFGYAYYLGETYEMLQRCYLTEDAENRIAELVQSNRGNSSLFSRTKLAGYIPDQVQVEEFWSNLYGDVWETRKYVLGYGFGLTIGISLLYMMLLRLPFLLTALVWISILGTIAVFVGGGYYSYQKASEWAEQISGAADAATYGTVSDETTDSIRDKTDRYLTFAAYFLWIVAAILALLACCLRKQIQLAIGCVKEAGKAVNSMILILIIPIFQTIGLMAFFLVWGYYAAQLASMGTIIIERFPVNPVSGIEIPVRYYEFDEFVTQCGWYLLFCLYWTTQFITAIGDMMIALSISKWYFAPNKNHRASSLTVISSITTTLIYHLGTCAYGSLIIAIIQLIRSILAKIQREVEKVSNKQVAGVLLCCCQCCFCCLEQCMKFINKNAYIQTAIFGTSFCSSARKAFFLILRNAARIGAVSYVSWAVLFIGKLFISSFTTLIAYYTFFESDVAFHVTSFVGPLVIIFAISYVIAGMCMAVFEISILTILHCFIADEEMFNGTARYANSELTSWIDKNGGL